MFSNDHPSAVMSVLDSNLQRRNEGNVYLHGAMPFYRNPKDSKHLTQVAPAPPPKYTNGEKNEVMEAFDDSTQNTSNIFDGLKPIYNASRLLGIFPLSHSGFVFQVSTIWIIYSVLVLLSIIGYTAYLKWQKLNVTRNAEGRFEEAVIDYLFTVYLFPIFINLIMLYEAKKQANVLTQMINFERIYSKVFKKRIKLDLGNKPLIMTIILFILGCGTMIVAHLTTTNFVIYQLIPFCYINVTTYMVGGAWYIYCDVIGDVATSVAEEFQQALRNVGASNKVADYRSLWMMLSRIIRNVGNSFGYSMTFLCLYLFFVTTLTIYGLLSQIQEGMGIKDVGLMITGASAIFMLYFICNEAHYASTCVRTYFQKKILLVELSSMDEDSQQEINMFLRATEMNPTDMCLCGFFDVNRNLFKSLLATMVTYLVVLLQFQISIPDSAESSMLNSTLTNATRHGTV